MTPEQEAVYQEIWVIQRYHEFENPDDNVWEPVGKIYYTLHEIEDVIRGYVQENLGTRFRAVKYIPTYNANANVEKSEALRNYDLAVYRMRERSLHERIRKLELDLEASCR